MIGNELDYAHYNPTGSPVSPGMSQEEASRLIEYCNGKEAGFLHPNTMLRNVTIRELVKAAQTYSKAIIMAVYNEVQKNRQAIVSGEKNINVYIMLILKEIAALKNVCLVFSRTANKRPTLLFHMFEKYLSEPASSGVSLEFLKWMDKQHLAQVALFAHQRYVILLRSPKKACEYLMSDYVETWKPAAPSLVQATSTENPQQKESTSPAQTQTPPHIQVPSIAADGGPSINSPRLDFRWLQHVPNFGLTFTCASIEEASELIQFAAHLRAKYSAADLVG
jgi:hypothetical protein